MPPLDSPPPVASTSKANSVENPTMPPLYVCYILRSKAKGAFSNRSYIGSTPDPPRRFRQHNGAMKGGAWRTSLNGPWEMEAFVYGFPNKLSALQFEWAWDHAEKTHWLVAAAPAAETEAPSSPVKKPAAKGKGKKKAALEFTSDVDVEPPPTPTQKGKGKAKVDVIRLFPKEAGGNRLLQRFAAMQRLLTVPPFSAYKLGVYLFSPHAETLWADALKGKYYGGWADKMTTRVLDGSKRRQAHAAALEMGPPDLGRIAITVRHAGVDGKRPERERGVAYGSEKEEGVGTVVLEADDTEFATRQWAKWEVLAIKAAHTCSYCKAPVSTQSHLNVALCPADGCSSLSHLTCLASHFIASEVAVPARDDRIDLERLMPIHGTCPSCRSALHWQDVVRSCWRRHDRTRAPGKKSRKKKVVAALAESDEGYDSDVIPVATGQTAVEDDESDESERELVEIAEKEASFDAGYLWQPSDGGEDLDDEGAPSSPVKRPRSRSTSPASSSSSPAKRGPGRPRKSVDAVVLSSDSAPSTPVKRRRRSLDKKVTSSPLPDALAASSSPIKPNVDSPTAPLSTPSEIGTRFSAIELGSSPLPAAAPSPTPSPVKRGPGRPRKAPVVIDLSD